ncbi:MAG: family 1 glycosylhydrolase [Candidatus Omnitrophica bacterium]|nr:family 1 glycosylhydrolase [Candidatus Omnitrophota bacterium]
MKADFPEDFLWGAATSAHQVEGNNFFNDWWRWEQEGHTSASGKACDHYHLFKKDFHLARELGHNAHRLGIEWSRLEKEEGTWDYKEWEHYKTALDELISHGIEPIVTLHHFTLPLWLSDKGGWRSDESVDRFSRFALKAIEQLGSRTRYWITINEPNILAVLGYFWGKWPPCKKDLPQMLLVLRNMLKAHSQAYRIMHLHSKEHPGIKPPSIGIAKAVTAFHPAHPFSPLDRLYAWSRNRFHNHSFIKSAIRGKVLIPGLARERLPWRDSVDFIGLNYYFRQFIRANRTANSFPFGEVQPPGEREDTGPVTDMGWEVYPEGLYETVRDMSRYAKPIMITENGVATADDELRCRFIKEHLEQLSNAVAEGYLVIGYIHWSLLDNFEWAEGFSKRFGLVRVDFSNMEREIKPSGRYLAGIIATGTISD